MSKRPAKAAPPAPAVPARSEAIKDLFVELGAMSVLLGAAYQDALLLRALMMGCDSAEAKTEIDVERSLVCNLAVLQDRGRGLLDGLGYKRVGISFTEGETAAGGQPSTTDPQPLHAS